MNRISVSDLKISVKITKFKNLTDRTLTSMISLFSKCEPELVKEVPNFFTKYSFLGDENPEPGTTIFLLYSMFGTKTLIGFLVMSNLIYKNRVVQKPLEKFVLNDERGGYLWWICGDPEYKGVSVPLFTSFDKYLTKNGYHYTLLVIEKEKYDTNLRKLYNRIGYKKIGAASFHKKDDMVVMVR